jgi:hypothetical protein
MARRRAIFALIALAGLPGSALALEAGIRGAAPLLRHFGRVIDPMSAGWILACDNTRICRAQPDSTDGSLMVRRDPGPTGRLLVVLDGQDPSDGPSIPDPASIRVTGSGRFAPAPWRLDRGGETAVLEGEAALRFVRAIADAGALTYRAGGEERTVSLRGMKAALLAMDEAQGRVNGVTAFTRIGPRPASAVLPPLPLPVLHIPRPPAPSTLARGFAERVRRANPRMLTHAECVHERWGGDLAYPLNAREAIVMLECMHGTHSTTYLLLRVRRDAPGRAAIIVLPPAPGIYDDDFPEDRSGLYPDVEWDPARGTLFSSSYACAHTCGDNLLWGFDGRAFVIAEYVSYQGGGAEVLDIYRTEIRVVH